MSLFNIGQGDLSPDMTLNLTINGEAADLTGATLITMRWKKPDGTYTTKSLTAVTLSSGIVKADWTSGDTSVAGIHHGQVVVTLASGELRTFPSDGTTFEWTVGRSIT